MLKEDRKKIYSLKTDKELYPDKGHPVRIIKEYYDNADVITSQDDFWVCEKNGTVFFICKENDDYKVTEALKREMFGGKVTKYLFSYDGLHIAKVSSDNNKYIEVLPLDVEQIKVGMKCTYQDISIEYPCEERLVIYKDFGNRLISQIVKVKESDEVVVNIESKTLIKGINGSEGIFAFFDQIAEQSKFEPYPTYCGWFRKIADKYIKEPSRSQDR